MNSAAVLPQDRILGQARLWILWSIVLFSGSFFWFFLAYPGIGRGVWPQSEAINIAYHLTSLGLSVCLIRFSILYPKHMGKIAAHPLVLFPFLVGVWSLAILPRLDFPLRHFIGLPQNGEGALWWLNFSIFSFMAIFLCRLPYVRRGLFIVALIGFLVCFTPYMANRFLGVHLPTPYNFPDYMAWSILALFVMAWTFVRPLMSKVGLFAAYVIATILTGNQAGILFAVLGAPILFGCFYIRKRGMCTSRQMRLVLVLLFIGMIPLVWGVVEGIAQVLTDADGHVHRAPGLYSVIARAFLFKMGYAPLFENPAGMMTGFGWGMFPEHVFKFLPISWIDVTTDINNQWDFVAWDHFHPHNIFIETLVSTGLVGFLLVIALWAGISMAARRRMLLPAVIFSGGAVTLGSFWFIFVVNVPFLALALGWVAGPTPALKVTKKLRGLWAVFLGVAILQGAGALLAAQTMMTYDKPQEKQMRAHAPHCIQTREDTVIGDVHLARLLTGYAHELSDKFSRDKNPAAGTAELSKLNDLFCRAGEYRAKNRLGLRLHYAILTVRGEMLFMLRPLLTRDLLDFYQTGWEEDVEAWLSRAPHRTDLAVPYLSYYIVQGDDDRVGRLAQKIHSQSMDDPVGLWFTGLILLKDSDPRAQQEGLHRLRRALDYGIERYMVVDPTIKAQIK